VSISVVIPALNEEAYLPGTLKALRDLGSAGMIDEILVIDGGSSDSTQALARRTPGVSLHVSSPGRAAQMNVGLRHATGRIVLFLHADTILEAGAIQEMMEALRDPAVVGGAFRFGMSGKPCILGRLLERGVAARCRWFNLPYGDQALFVRRCVCVKLGGFAEIPALEDVDLVMRLRRLGNLAILQSRAVTSGRAWRQRGIFHTLVNMGYLALMMSGLSPRSLAGSYSRWRGWSTRPSGGGGRDVVQDSPVGFA